MGQKLDRYLDMMGEEALCDPVTMSGLLSNAHAKYKELRVSDELKIDEDDFVIGYIVGARREAFNSTIDSLKGFAERRKN